MKYLVKTAFEDIKEKYDCIVGWGTGTLLTRNYRKSYFPMDFIIDGRGNNLNSDYQGIQIYPIEKLRQVKGKILIVIYTIYEREIIDAVNQLEINADTIIYNLLELQVENKKLPLWNGKNADDMLLLELAFRLELDNIECLDIGVCHPVMRNNTYIFCELGYRSVLVEPNPEFHSLIESYRPTDTLLKIGASNQESELVYYNFLQVPGYNTFVEEIAKARQKIGFSYTEQKILLKDINTIIEENFNEYPNILDIDVEGLDYQILASLDSQKYPIDIIMCECCTSDEELLKLMKEKGYRVYARTLENYIFVMYK